MLSKIFKFLFKYFSLPIIGTFVSWRHDDLNTFSDIATTFCIYFTLNWFFAVTILEWNFQRGEKLTQEKKARDAAKKKEQEQES